MGASLDYLGSPKVLLLDLGAWLLGVCGYGNLLNCTLRTQIWTLTSVALQPFKSSPQSLTQLFDFSVWHFPQFKKVSLL